MYTTTINFQDDTKKLFPGLHTSNYLTDTAAIVTTKQPPTTKNLENYEKLLIQERSGSNENELSHE